MSQTAVVNYAPEKHSVELRDVPTPTPGEEEVLLEVRAASVCGSDLHQWTAQHSWPVHYPVILGHEFCGTVHEIGLRVTGWKSGDRVVSETAAVIDPENPLSRRGLYNLDPGRKGFGNGIDGAMTRYVRVPARCLHRIPDELAFEHAALTEPCCVAYNAVAGNVQVSPGDRVVVLGPGPIGLLCGVLAQLHGAEVVIVGLERDRKRLEAAAHYGLDPLVQKNVRLQGSFSHNWPIWERVVALLSSRRIDVSPIVDGPFGAVWELDQWEEAFEKMHAGEIVKAVLKPV